MSFFKRILLSFRLARAQRKEMAAKEELLSQKEELRRKIHQAAYTLLQNKDLLEVGSILLIIACGPHGSCLHADQEKAQAMIKGALRSILLNHTPGMRHYL